MSGQDAAMTPCPREPELTAALARGFVPPEVAAHAAACPACAELHALAAALLDEGREAIAEAPVPAAGTTWWRLRLRHRHDAAARARRTLLVGQAATVAAAIALAVVFFGAELAALGRTAAAGAGLGAVVGTPGLIAVAAAAALAAWAVRRRLIARHHRNT